jgi:divalent metal cation (Fe/Co/Zn/Cd) transporter
MRRSGSEVFADLTLSVGPAVTFEMSHAIADQAAEAVRSVVPEADVVVHAEPSTRHTPDLTTLIRLLAARNGLGVHAIRLYEEQGKRRLELHLEVQESLSLEEAHHQASAFEQAVRVEVPGLTQIVSHLEPAGDSTAVIRAEPADESLLRGVLEKLLAKNGLAPSSLHNVKVQRVGGERVGGELQVSFHCRLDPSTTIVGAHDFTVKAEEFLRKRIPNLGRVVIHVEPKKA